MAEDQLRTIVEGIRARLQAELDAQLGSLTDSHERALAEVRESAAAEAARQRAAELEAARAEWEGRARVESEQAATEAASRTRRELEAALADERRRAEQEIQRLEADEERLRGELQELARLKADEEARRVHVEQEAARLRAHAEELRTHAEDEIARLSRESDELRQRVDRDLAHARAALEAERVSAASAIAEARTSSAASAAAGAGTAELLDGIRAIDDSTSLSAALAAVTRAAASQAARAAMFVVHGSELREWPVTGVAAVDAGSIRADSREAGFLSDVLRRAEPLTIGQNGGTPPEFARLPPGRSAVAVPFTLGGQPVAVLYADEGTNGLASRPWRDSIQILGRHASALLGYLTALKTAQAMQLLGGPPPSSAAAVEDETQAAARRYARLLVSEIKLYNEGAVRAGRERRDLNQRLKNEIDRARQLYDERVPASVRERDTYFQQELVNTLADGNQALLG